MHSGGGVAGRVLIGTQGWNYAAWVGPFYPDGTRSADILTRYAQAFGTVEVDSTFYAIPPVNSVRGWAGRTPDGFVFALKMPQLTSPTSGTCAARGTRWSCSWSARGSSDPSWGRSSCSSAPTFSRRNSTRWRRSSPRSRATCASRWRCGTTGGCGADVLPDLLALLAATTWRWRSATAGGSRARC
jgi:hypothetical protein